MNSKLAIKGIVLGSFVMLTMGSLGQDISPHGAYYDAPSTQTSDIPPATSVSASTSNNTSAVKLIPIPKTKNYKIIDGKVYKLVGPAVNVHIKPHPQTAGSIVNITPHNKSGDDTTATHVMVSGSSGSDNMIGGKLSLDNANEGSILLNAMGTDEML